MKAAFQALFALAALELAAAVAGLDLRVFVERFMGPVSPCFWLWLAASLFSPSLLAVLEKKEEKYRSRQPMADRVVQAEDLYAFVPTPPVFEKDSHKYQLKPYVKPESEDRYSRYGKNYDYPSRPRRDGRRS